MPVVRLRSEELYVCAVRIGAPQGHACDVRGVDLDRTARVTSVVPNQTGTIAIPSDGSIVAVVLCERRYRYVLGKAGAGEVDPLIPCPGEADERDGPFDVDRTDAVKCRD